jgi:ATP synthase protein I
MPSSAPGHQARRSPCGAGPGVKALGVDLTKHTVGRLLTLQLAVAVAGLALFAGLYGARAGWSAFAGGAIGFITTAFFALRVFGRGAERPAKDIVRAFYVGESQKILLTVVLFVAAIAWLELSFLPLFLTYMAGLAAFWIVLLPALSGTHE